MNDSSCRPNKIWVDKDSEVYKGLIKLNLKDNGIKMHSTHNERKSVVAERFIRAFKNKLYKYMTSVSKNVYIDKLTDIANKCNNTCHNTIKRNPVDVNSTTYINLDKENNEKDAEFNITDHARMSKYKKICKRLCSKLTRRSFHD